MKKLFADEHQPWWRVHVIRNRQFGRRIVEPVLDSANLTKRNKSEIELVGSDVFLMQGDYIMAECEPLPEANCFLLIYYTHRSRLMQNERTCEANDYPKLFRLSIWQCDRLDGCLIAS